MVFVCDFSMYVGLCVLLACVRCAWCHMRFVLYVRVLCCVCVMCAVHVFVHGIYVVCLICTSVVLCVCCVVLCAVHVFVLCCFEVCAPVVCGRTFCVVHIV